MLVKITPRGCITLLCSKSLVSEAALGTGHVQTLTMLLAVGTLFARGMKQRSGRKDAAPRMVVIPQGRAMYMLDHIDPFKARAHYRSCNNARAQRDLSA